MQACIESGKFHVFNARAARGEWKLTMAVRYFASSGSGLHLQDGLRHQLVHLLANLRFGDGDALGGKIG
jgi:hypothetical protein